MEVLKFLLDNWYVLIAGVAILVIAGVAIYTFIKWPRSQQLEKIRQWLLYAVIEAEKELGSGTGQIKLRYVYDMFLGKFPMFAQFISFEKFSGLVDDALEKMNSMLNSGNKNVASYIEEGATTTVNLVQKVVTVETPASATDGEAING